MGKRLKLVREALNINQSSMAQVCDVTLRTVQSWESNDTFMRVNQLIKLAEKGCNPNFILFGEGSILIGNVA